MRRARATPAWLLAVLAACSPGDPAPPETPGRIPRGGDTVLLVAIDALRADHLATFGYALDPMPRLGALAREGLCVPDCATASTATNAALASLLTGLQARHHGVGSVAERGLHRLAPSRTTLAEVLAERGFRTFGLVSLPQLAAEISGLDQGFERWLAPELAETDRSASQSVWNARAELERALRRDGPLFVLAHFADAARTQAVPGDAAAAFLEAHLGPFRGRNTLVAAALDRAAADPDEGLARLDELLARGRGSPELLAYRAALYDGQLAHVDRALGELLDLLAACGRYEGALVAVVGTRGTTLGAAAPLTGPAFPRAVLETPLVLRFPGAAQVRPLDGVVGLVDLAPTVADWAGARPLGGAGLFARLEGTAPPAEVASCEDAAFAHRVAFDHELALERGPLGTALFDRDDRPLRAPEDPLLARRAARLRAALEGFDEPWQWGLELAPDAPPLEVVWRVEGGVARDVVVAGGHELGIGAAPARGRGVAGRARLDGGAELTVVAAERSLALRLDLVSTGRLDEETVRVGTTPLSRSLLPRLSLPTDEDDGAPAARLVVERAGGRWQRVTVGAPADVASGAPVELLVCRYPPAALDEELAWTAGARADVTPVPGRLDALWARGRAPLELQVECPPGSELALAATVDGAVVPVAAMRSGGAPFAPPRALALYLPDWLAGVTDALEAGGDLGPLAAGELRLTRTPSGVPPEERTGLDADALGFVRRLPARE